MSAATCTACGDEVVSIPPVEPEVTVDTVAVVALGPVGWRCPRRADESGPHDLLRPTADDVSAAIDDAFDVARRTRIRGQLRCGACDSPFVLPGRRTTRTVTVTGTHSPAVTLTFDLPVLRCTEDAIENVPPEAAEDARAAALRITGAADG